VAPYYFKPSDAEILADFCARVGESVPDLPVYFYHIPSLTGVNLPMINLLKNISAKLPNFAGIKFTNEDFMDYQSCLDFENGKYNMLWGRDECLLSALILGAKGFVGSTYNYAAPLYHKLISAFNNNELEEARIMQQKSINMIALLDKFGGIATGKAYMKYIGLDCGKFRLPVRNMTDKNYSDFVQAVDLLEMKYLLSVV
jgi:N-acetylneuraminate lyase